MANYRYLLTRNLGSLFTTTSPRRVLFCMLNPSTATAEEDDPTIRRVVQFASREDATDLAVVNLFAARATNPKKLPTFDNPVGPDNDITIRQQAAAADIIIAAWGVPPKNALRGREQSVIEMLTSHADVYRLGESTAEGHPRHPLYLAGATPLVLHARRR